MQLAQEWEARRDLPFEQDDDEREGPARLHPAVERLVRLWDSPLADAGFADEENEGVRFGQLLGELISPRAAARRFVGAKKTRDAESLH